MSSILRDKKTLSCRTGALRGRGHFVIYAELRAVLPLVDTEFGSQPTGAPREAQYKSRSDRCPRRAPVQQDSIKLKNFAQSSTSLCAIENSASSSRVDTPVLSKTFDRWRFTVSSLIVNCLAMSRLLQPSTMQVTTSSSRGVSP